MSITRELSDLLLEPSTILRLARERSQKFDHLSPDELIDHLLDVGESMRQQAIHAKTTIEDIPLDVEF